MTDDEITKAYQRYGHLVARRCRRILRDDEVAEDVLQEVFVRLWRYGDGFRAAESKVAWLYRVADRCCFDRLSSERKRREVTFDELLALPEDRDGRTGAVEAGEIVLRFLERFDDRTKQVAIHHYLDEMTQEEIAAATGWSRQTVHKKLAILSEHADRLRARLLMKSASTKGAP